MPLMLSGKKGLSLLEILVATFLMALIMAGVANVFVGGKAYILHSRSWVSAAQLAKKNADRLRQYVREDTWDDGGSANTNKLNIGDCSSAFPAELIPDNHRIKVGGVFEGFKFGCTTSYVNASNTIKRAVLTVQWDEE